MNLNLIREYIYAPFVGLNMLKENKDVVAEKYDFGSIFGQYYLYLPPKGNPKKKIIVYIHGGSFKRGVPNLYKCVIRRFSDEGYHTISLGYRLAPLFKYPAQIEDIATAYTKAMDLLKSYGVPTDEVVIIGASAGGHLGGVLAFDKATHKKFGIKSSDIKAFISLGGILKFNLPKDKYANNIANNLFARGYDRTLAEPFALLDCKNNMGVLCMHSLYDPIVNFENSRQFCKKLNAHKPGMAQCYIIDNPRILHTNLVSGLFLNKGPATYELKTLLEFISKT